MPPCTDSTESIQLAWQSGSIEGLIEDPFFHEDQSCPPRSPFAARKHSVGPIIVCPASVFGIKVPSFLCQL